MVVIMAILLRLWAAASAALLYGVLALALAAAQTTATPCDVVEPDLLAISWRTPCDDGRWLFDSETGSCRIWDWHPAPEDTATWSGACRSGRREGRGVVQWFEHGRPIDRFEGIFRRSKREGYGRYDWPTGERFHGTYVDDFPNGQGTAIIDGESFAGIWRRGCLMHGGKRIAIGVPLVACDGRPVAESARDARRHDEPLLNRSIPRNRVADETCDRAIE
jgi:hypothetical protein